MSNQLIQIVDRTKNGQQPAEHTPAAPPLDLATVREKLSTSNGQDYWRSLEELSAGEEFTEFLQREFPQQAPRDMLPLPRRDFLKLMGAALALAGVSGCAFQPAEKIVPYVDAPEDIVPGIPQFYATATSLGGYGLGLLAESNMGRPTKIEGNPDHPSSRGATDAIAQASILDLYDPSRSQRVRNIGNGASWEDFFGAALNTLSAQVAARGAGLRILTGTITSPSLIDQIQRLKARFPAMQWHQWEPVSRDGVRQGARDAFGVDVHPLYNFSKADTIVSLDSDFLLEEVGHVRHARDFSDRRRVRSNTKSINRLFVAESTPSVTGMTADHRIPVKASAIEALARAIAAGVGVAGVSGGAATDQKWLAAAVKDLQANRGTSLVVAGQHQPAAVHALVNAINAQLGNIGKTVTFTEPVEALAVNASARPINQLESLRTLVADMNAGRVDALIILGGNPVYSAPADLNFLEALKKVPFRAHHSLYDDETSEWCHWHLPETHYLENWGDVRAEDGTASIVQPLIEPLYAGTRSVHQVLSGLLDNTNESPYDVVRAYWQRRLPGGNFDKTWQKIIHDGLIPNTKAPVRAVTLKAGFAAGLPTTPIVAGTEINFRPDPSIWDGRYNNNAWLQELPKPLTKLVWDNAAIMSFATAEKLGVTTEDQVKLTVEGRSITAPVFILPGHADDSITVHLGYGRTRSGKVGTGTGFNAYALRSSKNLGFAGGAQVAKVSGRYRLATTAHHNLIDTRNVNGKDQTIVDGIHDRPLVQVGTIDQFVKDANSIVPEAIQRGLPIVGPLQEWKNEEEQGALENHNAEGSGNRYPSLYPNSRDVVLPDEKIENAWGMVIDTNVCIGCNACVIGCQSENNSAITGKDQVLMGREMHWLRIDTYFKGDVANPEAVFQPLTCMHCEKAPCEPVCPVEATQHSPEGINNMTYNRCIGTRYCSNNCPYKVRRFNYLQYSDQETPTITLMANPDVTVRSRGVMEKCTYCIQRVNAAKIQAEKEDRNIQDGEIVTACQQACPTGAIVFGDIKRKTTKVAELKQQPHHFGLLTELNTYPRTSYLAKIINPHPDLPRGNEFAPEGHGEHGEGHGAEQGGAEHNQAGGHEGNSHGATEPANAPLNTSPDSHAAPVAPAPASPAAPGAAAPAAPAPAPVGAAH